MTQHEHWMKQNMMISVSSEKCYLGRLLMHIVSYFFVFTTSLMKTCHMLQACLVINSDK